MKAACRAVIDIGTNSVKLLVAEVQDGRVQPLLEQGEQTRLGQGFYPERRLQPAAIARTVRAVGTYLQAAARFQAEPVRIIATSAVRDAVNRDEILDALRQLTPQPVIIITGDQEAALAFRGVTSDPQFAGRPILIAEVGGGSTQLIGSDGREQLWRRSFPLGAVRLYEDQPPSDPPTPEDLQRCQTWLHDFVRQHIRPLWPAFLNARPSTTLECVAAGGTGSVLACLHLGLERFERERIDRLQLRLAELQGHLARLWRMPLAERRWVRGLPPERADVILTGLAIYESLLRELHWEALRFSTRGVRFGALLEAEASR